MKNTSKNPMAELQAARTKRHELTTALPKLCDDSVRAEAHVAAMRAHLERVKDADAIGNADAATLKAAESTFNDAEATLRKARGNRDKTQEQISRIEQMLPGLTAAAYEVRIRELREPYETELLNFQKALLAAKAISDRVAAMYAAAVEEFPPVIQLGGGTPYPVAAGLEPFAWPELAEIEFAAHGGRLGAWLLNVQYFLDPASRPSQVTGQMESPIDPSPEDRRRKAGQKWYGSEEPTAVPQPDSNWLPGTQDNKNYPEQQKF